MKRKPTKAMLEARVAALEGLNEAQAETIVRQQRKLNELNDIVAVHRRVPQLSHLALSAACQALQDQGVPCRLHMGHIVHGVTGSVLI